MTKRLLLAVTLLVALPAALLHAQDVVGIWQGRCRYKDANCGRRSGSGMTAASSRRRSTASIRGRVSSPRSPQGSTVKMTVPAPAALTTAGWDLIMPPPRHDDSGRCAADEVGSKVTQRRRGSLLPRGFLTDAGDGVPASRSHDRLSEPDTPGQSITARPHVQYVNQTVSGMMTFASAYPDQIVGGPQWLKPIASTSPAEPGHGNAERQAVAGHAAQADEDRFGSPCITTRRNCPSTRSPS